MDREYGFDDFNSCTNRIDFHPAHFRLLCELEGCFCAQDQEVEYAIFLCESLIHGAVSCSSHLKMTSLIVIDPHNPFGAGWCRRNPSADSVGRGSVLLCSNDSERILFSLEVSLTPETSASSAFRWGQRSALCRRLSCTIVKDNYP